MPLPPDIDKKIRERFEELETEAKRLMDMEIPDTVPPVIMSPYRSPSGEQKAFERQYKLDKIKIRENISNLFRILSGNSDKYDGHIQKIQETQKIIEIYGIISAFREDYENGFLNDVSQMIETNVNTDYRRIAEQIFEDSDENVANGHVPAGILMGAVLENSLRTLCQRKGIDILNDKGDYKTLDPLITDLQKANIFNKAKADMLKSWAKIRNYLAHGHFNEVSRQDVEDMISGVKRFLAEYL